MKSIPVDPVYLMNIMGTLTARAEDDFEGYDGSREEDPSEFLPVLLSLLIDEETQGGKTHDEKEVSSTIASLFHGLILEKVRVQNHVAVSLQS